jgi:acetolactate synthase regulatory subunit
MIHTAFLFVVLFSIKEFYHRFLIFVKIKRSYNSRYTIYKGFNMISSTTSASSATDTSTMAVSAQKKAQDVQTQQLTKLLDGAQQQTQQQTQQVTAQKTGMGNSLNITG